FVPYMQAQQERAMEQQQAYDMAEREFQNRLAIEKYKRENPESPAMAKNFQWFEKLSPEQQAAFERYQNIVQPDFVTGPDGQTYQRERSSGPVPIQISPEDWDMGTPVGGAGSNASGGF
ncbi:MAG: hypothetical protein EBT13_18805, partial [Rhodobacteraceae bacterium]|nr:hypothetical protein [Paracoccaceae bacterium]